MMDLICDELGIPKKYIKTTNNNNRFIVLVQKNWLKSLIKHSELIKFIDKHLDIWPEENDKNWTKIFICIYQKNDTNVLSIPTGRLHQTNQSNGLMFSQLMHYIDQKNYKNLWKETYRKYHKESEDSANYEIATHNDVLRQIIIRFYGCSLINVFDKKLNIPFTQQQEESHPNLLPANCAIETLNAIFLVHTLYIEHSLKDAVTFSPAIFEKSHTKALYIIYQLLNLIKHLIENNLILGDITLDDIYITEDMWLYIFPSIKNNLQSIEIDEKLLIKLHEPTIFDNLEKVCELWLNDTINNFQYINLLNRLSGRKYGDPNCHYVFPWVTDFTTRCGKNWRDLKKSKYRLNKGDKQLDLTYNNQSQVAHHVSDVLSPITYYVYMARRTPKSVLCKNVRTQWVPAEYPSSIQRLQEWTPDECIPEFFNDPTIFCSIHEDLDDLELPTWATSPEDFIEKHREALESQHVSERLHYWIDLTFGYKLDGNPAIRAKNVCLNLVDNHLTLTKSGLVQLFTQPHPQKLIANQFTSKPPTAPIRNHLDVMTSERSGDDTDESDQINNTLTTFLNRTRIISPTITLPIKYKPELVLDQLEKRHQFFTKTFHQSEAKKFEHLTNQTVPFTDDDLHTKNAFTNRLFHETYEEMMGKRRYTVPQYKLASDSTNRKVRQFQMIGCLMVEIFMSKRLRALNPTNFEERLKACLTIMRSCRMEIPTSINHIVEILLQPDGDWPNFAYPSVNSYGLPPPNIHLYLEPLMQFFIPFPKPFQPLYNLMISLKQYQYALNEYHILYDSTKYIDNINECLVKNCAKNLQSLSDELNPTIHDGLIDILIPAIKQLIEDQSTSVLAAWYLFDPFSRLLGLEKSSQILLPSLLKLYEMECNEKIAKLYHHSFILRLIVRFGTRNFLENFTVSLVEAVGRYKDEIDSILHKITHLNTMEMDMDEKSIENFSMGEEAIFITELDENQSNDPDDEKLMIKSFKDDTMISDVSTESLIWLAHRIGPVLTAKYISRNLLKMLTLCYAGKDNLITQMGGDLDDSFVVKRVLGDHNALKVLECLTSIVGLYGEQFILLQFIPHISELILLCEKKITTNLEGGLVSCLALIKHFIPYLSDGSLMDRLNDIITTILEPIQKYITSIQYQFPNGYLARNLLTRKYVSALYTLATRLGSEMTIAHLQHLFEKFFQCFTTDIDLKPIYTSEFAHNSYLLFADLIPFESLSYYEDFRKICERHANDRSGCAMKKLHTTQNSGSSNVSLTGNRIDIHQSEQSNVERIESHNRHLRGNWLAYWQHEIGRSDKDRTFDLKQIKLQTFIGHNAGVKCLQILDNENSFISGARDRTVKLWSLRCHGDGNYHTNCQWTYNGHKKSVLSLTLIDSLRLIASCDNVVHLWDPFMGVNLAQLDGLKNPPVNVLQTMPAPSYMIYAATTEGGVRLVDARLCQYINEWKIGTNSLGAVRCMTLPLSGNWLAVGQANGNIAILDTRNGLLIANWKAHESDVLHLVVLDETTLMSCSLDQGVSVWCVLDGKLKFVMRGPNEPITCLNLYGNELISGTTGNRIGIYPSIGCDAQFSSTKLKPDVFRGLLTSMEILELNRLLLLGSDTGNIYLLC